jgi:carbamoyl-phosphate synthase large subunit
LINIQYAVQGGTVYVLEVNPRASRTVPFVSKATGVPLAKVAAQVMVGLRLKEALAPWKEVIARKKPWYSVKEVVFPWLRFPEVDVVLGPEMRSTGEVMGVDENYGLAFAKSQAAAGGALPKSGTILFSLRTRDRVQSLPIAKAFQAMGYGLMATEGTYEFLKDKGLNILPVKKIAEGRPNVLDVIKNREVVLVVNTPQGHRARSDGFNIRRTSLLSNVPIVTTYAAARAVVEGLQKSREKQWQARSLQELYTTALPAAPPTAEPVAP